MQTLDIIDINPKHDPVLCIIWLHGLGASGHDLANLVPMLPMPRNLPTRFVFPNAPHQAVTANAGMIMPAWYDILGWEYGSPEDSSGIKRSADLIATLIAQEQQRGFDSKQIILAGFSQGGALAMYAGLSYPLTLGGLILLSTYMPIADQCLQDLHASNQNTPIFIGHGKQDTIVPLSWGHQAYTHLIQRGCNVTWKEYTMDHSICPKEMLDMLSWLKNLSLINS
ncbi:MAG: phospholipase/carboxylesterase [Gammaproteobacteria bacterium]